MTHKSKPLVQPYFTVTDITVPHGAATQKPNNIRYNTQMQKMCTQQCAMPREILNKWYQKTCTHYIESEHVF